MAVYDLHLIVKSIIGFGKFVVSSCFYDFELIFYYFKIINRFIKIFIMFSCKIIKFKRVI